MDWAMGLGQALSSPLGRPSARARCRLPPIDELGVGDERAGGRREPFSAVLADADDGEPSRLLTGGAHNATSCGMTALKLLILGGSGEAADLARALHGDARYDVTLSLAGQNAGARGRFRASCAPAASAAPRALRAFSPRSVSISSSTQPILSPSR